MRSRTSEGWISRDGALRTATAVGLAACMLLSSCGLLPSAPTITVKDDRCAYSGPNQVPGQASFQWDIQPTSSGQAFTFIFGTLGPGKTRADLMQLQGIDLVAPPPWFKSIHYSTLLGGRSVESINLGAQRIERLDPIYILCIGVKGLIGVVGPIQVKPT